MKRFAIGIVVCSFWLVAVGQTGAPQPARGVQVVLLGTGTPLPDPERSGPSTAVVAGGRAYIFDAGTGVVRRAAAARDKGVGDLEPRTLRLSLRTTF